MGGAATLLIGLLAEVVAQAAHVPSGVDINRSFSVGTRVGEFCSAVKRTP